MFGYLAKILLISRDIFGKLSASYKQVDVLVDILDKQLIFRLIYPVDIYCEYYPKLKTAALSAVRKGLGDL